MTTVRRHRRPDDPGRHAAATFKVELDGIVPGMSGPRHAGLRRPTKLQRSDWGLNWNVALEQGGWLVGKEIRLEIAVAADEVAGAEAAELVAAAS